MWKLHSENYLFNATGPKGEKAYFIHPVKTQSGRTISESYAYNCVINSLTEEFKEYKVDKSAERFDVSSSGGGYALSFLD